MKTNIHKLFDLGLASLAALMLLAIACSREGEQRTEPLPEPDNSKDTREVLLTLKNRLAITTPSTKAGDQPIATAAENAISALDVYVFGSDRENGEYSFLERLAYRAYPAHKLPKDAAPLQLTASAADGQETTGLLKLKKGLFVKLYCIANDTAMFDPATGKTVAAADFTPLALAGGENEKKTVATPGKPLETTFTTWHTHLLAAGAKADTIVTPLAMSGALATPLDLTDFNSTARLQAGLRLTRLVTRYDIENKAGDSRFIVETVSIGNARRGSSYFPIRVHGKLPEAEPGDLITLPARAFNGPNANQGLATGAFYSYPSPKKDKAFIILKGKYQVNETETKDVSYQIPFTQPQPDGTAAWLDINGNHRYTISIAKADPYHLEADIQIADWADDGSIDYTPDNKPGEINVTIPVAWATETSDNYDDKRKIHTVSMSLKTGSTFNFSTAANSALTLDKTYAGNATTQQYDWLLISEPVISGGNSIIKDYTYNASLTPGYKMKKYPRATLRIRNTIDGSESILYVEAIAVPQPEETKQPAKAPNGTSDNPNTFNPETASATMYRITGSSTNAKITCPDGIELDSKPDWLDVSFQEHGAETIVTLTLNNRDLAVDGDQGVVTLSNRKKPELKTDIIVTLLPAGITPVYEVGNENQHIPGTGADKPDDITLKITKDNVTTVTASSMDGVKVEIDYPDGSPAWLRFDGASAADVTKSPSAVTRADRPLIKEQIKFIPIEEKLTGAKKATVILHNVIGGKDHTFTITPNMQPGTAEKDSQKDAVPLQNKLDANAKTITIYQLPGEKASTSTFPITVTSLGGSILAFEKTSGTGSGIVLDKTESIKNTAEYTLTPALDATDTKVTGVLHVKNYTQPDKMTDYAVTILRSDLTGTNEVTLTAQKDQAATTSISSFHGFTIDKTTVDWQGGSQWFNIATTDFDGGEKKTVTFIANTATTQVRPATVTLKNKIADGGDLQIVVTPAYTVPSLATSGAADPTQNTLTAGPAASTIKLYRVSNSKIILKATAIGGSYIDNGASGVSISGGNTYNTENTYTVTLNNNATGGSFKIVNKSDNKKIQTVTVQAPVATMTATNLTGLPVTLGTSQNSTVSSPEGFQASVNWGGGGQWFDLTGGDAQLNYAKTTKTVGVKVKSSLGNISIKTATVTLKNKIRGGADVTFTVKPTLGTPTLKKTGASISGSLPTGSNIALANNTRLTLYKKDGANSTMTITATCYGGTRAVISGAGLSVSPNNSLTTNTTQNYVVTSTVYSGSGTLTIYNSDNSKSVSLPITMADGEIRINDVVSGANVTLYPKSGETSTVKIKSATGVQSWYVSSWNSGGTSDWFTLPSTPGAGEQTLTLRAVTKDAVQKQATVTLRNKISGCSDRTFTVTPAFRAPEATSTNMTLKAGQNNNVPYIDITGICPGGSTITGPSWVTIQTTSTNAANYSYKVELKPSKSGFPTSVPGNQTFTITNRQNSNLRTTVTVNITEDNAWIAKDLTGYDNASEQRVTINGKTLTVEVYGMFVTPTFNANYNGTYCTALNGGNTWLNSSNLAKTEIVNNRRKYTFNVVVNATPTSHKEYRYFWHEANPQIKYGNTLVKQYKIIRGQSIYPYPAGGGSPYYSCVSVGGKWWAPVNCGATEVGIAYYVSEKNRGNYYQWGRWIAATPGMWVFNGASSSIDGYENYYTGQSGNWTTHPDRASLWQNGFKDPCPAGYRVPTLDEIKILYNNGSWFYKQGKGIDGANGITLLLPAAGYLKHNSNLNFYQEKVILWTSTARDINYAYRYNENSGGGKNTDADDKILGASVRCIKK